MEKHEPLPHCTLLEESPQVIKTKQFNPEKGKIADQINRSSEFVLESKSLMSSQRNFEAEGHSRLVQMIETKYLASQLRLYCFPGHKEEDEDSIVSLNSLKKVGKYNLQSQNHTRQAHQGPNLQQLDFTKLLKRRGRPLNSEREAMITRIDLQNICPTSRHQKSGIFEGEKSSPGSQKPCKQFTDTFLKGFLKRINLKKDKEPKSHAVKKNFASSIKLKSPFNPRLKDKSLSLVKQKQDSLPQSKAYKPSRVTKDVSRRDLLLQYLKDCRVSLEKIKSKQSADKIQKQGRSSGRLNSNISQRDRAAFSSLAIEKPSHNSRTQKSCYIDKNQSTDRSQKSYRSSKNLKKKPEVHPHEATDSIAKHSRSFHKEKSSSRKSKRSANKSKEIESSTSKLPRQSNTLIKSKYSTKFTAITKLVINNQKAYLHFDDRPKSDRFF